MQMKTAAQESLFRARLLLEEEQSEAAQDVLDKVHPENEEEQHDIAYLLGWCYVQRRRWNDAMQALSPLLSAAQKEQVNQTVLLERERLAYHLLRLGSIAVNLAHYEDASQHFALCLKVLQDRRVHLPQVRIKARYGLAMTYIMRGFFTVAIQHYEEAVRLCIRYDETTELPNIYYGVCEAYRLMGKFFEAREYALKALSLYEKQGNVALQARILNMLGCLCNQIGDFEAAYNYYTHSLKLAIELGRTNIAMIDCAALAEMYMDQGQIENAKNYCECALNYLQNANHVLLRGSTYQIVGKVTLAEARLAVGARRLELFEEGMAYFRKAQEELISTQAYIDLAEIYGNWAEALEELDRDKEALRYWQSAYETMRKAKQLSFA